MKRRAWHIVLATLIPVCPAARAQEAVEIDVLDRLGLEPQRVREMIERSRRSGGQDHVHVYFTLHDESGRYLANAKVRFAWKGGEQEVNVPDSGLIHFDLEDGKIEGLTLRAPPPYDRLRQRSLPNAGAYEPDPRVDRSGWGKLLVEDERIEQSLRVNLRRLLSGGKSTPAEDLRAQLRRASCRLELPEAPTTEMSPSEIYRARVDSVVVVSSLDRKGHLSHASGVAVAPGGVIVTNAHVFDKLSEPAIVYGVMTRVGKFYPLVEILASNRSADVAIIRVDAPDLPPVPLSAGDETGDPVTVISHPAGRFFMLTRGYIARFSSRLHFGRAEAIMTITADYAVGSSGAPVFNRFGAVAGIASSTNAVRDQMVFKDCPPARAIRAMIERPTAEAGRE